MWKIRTYTQHIKQLTNPLERWHGAGKLQVKKQQQTESSLLATKLVALKKSYNSPQKL
jgi:hypothetical protein